MQQQQENRLLLQAIFEPNPQQVKRLLQQGANPNYVNGGDLFRPLHFVVSDPHTQTFRIMDLLVEHGADLDASTQTGFTPLDLATRFGNDAIVKRLLDMGADSQKMKKHASNKKSKSLAQQLALYQVQRTRHAKKRPSLIQKQVAVAGGGRPSTPQQSPMSTRQATDLLFQGVQQMDTTKIRRAIRNGAQLNSRRNGETPMTVLLQRHPDKEEADLIKIINLLLQNNANVNFKDSSHHTPLWFAQADNRIKIADFIKRKGGVSDQQQKPKTPQQQRNKQVLDFITENASFDIARFFKELYKHK